MIDGSHRATLRPFTPSREPAEALAARTVGRDEVLDAICARMRAAARSKNRPHTLIVGPRGSGKTHVIEVVLHRVLSDDRCRARVAVARVDEDAVGIVSYADVLVEVLSSLGPAPDVLATARRTRDVAALERAVHDQLGGRVLLVVIENLSRLFGALGTSGQRDLRSFVETSGQVVLLASTPLLFRAIASRDEPWFGSFAIEHLMELTLDEGSELLRRLALEDGDVRFVDFLDGPRGRARLTALHHLAGGSPRLWMILASCATVELLDELVPAVEQLLEKLVTYFQQRLWELPGNEARLVRELGTGPPSAPVADIAAACGLEERTVANSLGRLAEAGWVRGEKLPGSDQRKTWYRLREPLLRHHFQYRRSDGEPLRLIVDVLRVWFDPSERRGHLASARPASQAERHLLATMSLDPPERSDEPWADRNLDRLLTEARRWISDRDTIGTAGAGVIIEAAVVAFGTSTAAARKVLRDRDASSVLSSIAERLFALVELQAAAVPVEDTIGELLDVAAAAVENGPDRLVLGLVAAGWNAGKDPLAAVRRLEAIVEPSGTDRLRLTIRAEYGYWLEIVGRHQEAIDVLRAVLDDRTRVLGLDHPDTLQTSHDLAYTLSGLGHHDQALSAFSSVVEDRTRVLGADHRDTLEARYNVAFELGAVGRHDDAATAYGAALKDETRVLGADHPDTLATRMSLAFELGELGRHSEAVAALYLVLDSEIRILGEDHPATLATRRSLALELGGLSRHDEAVTIAVRGVDAALAGFGAAHDEYMKAIRTVVDLSVGVLRAGRPLPAAQFFGSFASTTEFELVKSMEAARDGSVEAAARLPTELRSLVNAISADAGRSIER